MRTIRFVIVATVAGTLLFGLPFLVHAAKALIGPGVCAGNKACMV